MYYPSPSFQNEMMNIATQRTIKIALVLALHATLIALVLHIPSITPPEFLLPIQIELITPGTESTQQLQQLQPAKQPEPTQHTRPHQPEQAPIPATTMQQPTSQATSADPVPLPAAPISMAKESVGATAASQSQAMAQVMVPARVDASYLQRPEPVYPPFSQLSGQQGVVMLAVKVTAKGEVSSVEIKQTSGYTLLDKSARDTVKQWRFVPARRGDVAMDDTVDVPIRFDLKNKK
jgi:protein TonB